MRSPMGQKHYCRTSGNRSTPRPYAIPWVKLTPVNPCPGGNIIYLFITDLLYLLFPYGKGLRGVISPYSCVVVEKWLSEIYLTKKGWNVTSCNW